MTISLRIVIAGFSALLIFVCAAVVLGVAISFSTDAVRGVALNQVARLVEVSHGRVESFFQVPLRMMSVLQKHARLRNDSVPSSSSNPTETLRMWEREMIALQAANNFEPAFIGVGFADGCYAECGQIQEENRTVRTEIILRSNSSVDVIAAEYGFHSMTTLMRERSESVENERFDPRRRPWYNYSGTAEVKWVAPFLTIDPTMLVQAAGLSLRNRNGERIGVLLLALSFESISSLLIPLQRTKNTHIVLFHQLETVAISGHFIVASTVPIPFRTDVLVPANSTEAVPNNCLRTDTAIDRHGVSKISCRVRFEDYNWDVSQKLLGLPGPRAAILGAPATPQLEGQPRRPPLRNTTSLSLYVPMDQAIDMKGYFLALQPVQTTVAGDGVRGLSFQVLVVMPELDVMRDVVRARDYGMVVAAGVFVVLTTFVVVSTGIMVRPLLRVSLRMKSAATVVEGEVASATTSIFSEVRDIEKSYDLMRDELNQLMRFVPQTVMGDDAGSGANTSSRPSVTLVSRTCSTNALSLDDSVAVNPLATADGIRRVSGTAAHSCAAAAAPSIRGGNNGAAAASDDAGGVRGSPPVGPLSLATDRAAPGVAAAGAFAGLAPGVKIDGSPGLRAGAGSPHPPYVPLKVSRHLIGAAENSFTARSVTVVLVTCFDIATHDTDTLGKCVGHVLDVVIDAALSSSGFVESMDPSSLLLSFNAHSVCPMHENQAARFVLGLREKLPPTYFIAVDTTTCFVGTIGAHGRNARLVLGEAVDVVRRLPSLMRSFLETTLLLTERCARNVTIARFASTDIVAPAWSQPGRADQLVVCALEEDVQGSEHDVFRQAFGLLCCGKTAEAAEVLDAALASAAPGRDADSRLLRLSRATTATLAAKKKNDGSGASPAARYRRAEGPPWDAVGQSPREITVDSRAVKRAAEAANALLAEEMRRLSTVSDVDLTAVVDLCADPVAGSAGKAAHTHDDSVLSSSQPVAPLNPAAVAPLPPPDAGRGLPVFSPVRNMSRTDSMNSGMLSGWSVEDSDEDHRLITAANDTVWLRSRREIGGGSGAKVYQGLSETGSVCALKAIDMTNRHLDVTSLAEEVEICSRLRHSNIVSYVSCARDDDCFYILMEYVPGGSLRSTLNVYGRLSPQVTRRFAVQILHGLQYLHNNDIVHCDLKPHNVLFGTDGVIKLTDFGSSLSASSHRTKPRDSFSDFALAVRGTVWYVAPEVARGENPTPASDMWSFGITVLELLLGDIPWPTAQRCGNRESLFVRELGRNETLVPTVPDRVPEDLKKMLSACLERDGSRRPTPADILATYLAL